MSRLCKTAQSLLIAVCIAAVIVGFCIADAVEWIAQRLERNESK